LEHLTTLKSFYVPWKVPPNEDRSEWRRRATVDEYLRYFMGGTYSLSREHIAIEYTPEPMVYLKAYLGNYVGTL